MAPPEADVPRVHVAVADVHVRFTAPANAPRGPDSTRRWGRPAVVPRLGNGPAVVVRALAGISLVARAGEAIGVVGLNGSGKSTLLRTIAGLERPARGTVLASSAPVLLGVNAAMVGALTGRENLRLGCLAMGMSPAEVDAAHDGVVALAGIGDAVDRPMRTYSSGMAARLRFAIAAAAQPEVLLIDEALATGDAAFRQRSTDRIEQLRRGAGCVFLVSHGARTIEETCTRAIWLHQGRLVLDGGAAEVAQRYAGWAAELSAGDDAAAAATLAEAFTEGTDTVVALDARRESA
ncbi:ABC transporter ATP-binding protein [Litorihabitans aurantiacus]|uniref:Polysaccharide ABC transporter ATP-binding protein n=1 Tax=Litorihabitans aurantiacus TaxID=1930061 RepID=A0AA37XGE9_9MICO|nr:ABC transporter ATP-binding protein [Litorihabitans aurantiacus]GMA32703.1 polysaccharide ABC transporter ATP-binding protein [Litorihabitans aurantiacus]